MLNRVKGRRGSENPLVASSRREIARSMSGQGVPATSVRAPHGVLRPSHIYQVCRLQLECSLVLVTWLKQKERDSFRLQVIGLYAFADNPPYGLNIWLLSSTIFNFILGYLMCNFTTLNKENSLFLQMRCNVDDQNLWVAIRAGGIVELTPDSKLV